MSLFHPLTLTVRRKDPGSYVNGVWVEGTDVPDFTIKASWQPLNGKDLETLEEGERLRVVYKGYTETELFPADPLTQEEGDIIEGPDGKDYEVVNVEPWQNNLINHYKFMVTRLKEGV